ncbi:MAG: Clp protease ClpP [Aequorivita sp.]|nr:Clp protease ClpP [Aequorivita sp.]
MNGTIYINGVIGVDCEMIDVVRQYKSFDSPTAITVVIDSVGGYVDTGKRIYNYLKSLDVEVTTVAKGLCASIASYIFFAGDVRQMYEDAEIMIHLPSGGVNGTAKDIEDYSKEMRLLESELADFYTPFFNLDNTTIQSLLEEETWINSTTALDMGIVDSVLVSQKAVALFDNKKENKVKNEMTKNERTFFNVLKNLFTSEPVNLMIQDANGDEITFPDLEDDEVPTVKDGETPGSMAVDAEGLPIEGERTATNGDVWVFVAGELTEIKKAEDAPVEDAPVEEEAPIDVQAIIDTVINGVTAQITAQFKAENKALKDEIVSLKKLVGSEDVESNPTNQNNNTTSKSTSNYLTGVFRS